MTKISRPRDALLSLVEQHLGAWLTPDFIAALVMASCLALLAVIMSVPAESLRFLAPITGLGQNTLFVMLLFGVTMRFGFLSLRGPSLILGITPLVLSSIVMAQSLTNWLPTDGWYRLLLNTSVTTSSWPGRMSAIEAQLLFLISIAGLMLRMASKPAIAVAFCLIAGMALFSAARSAAFLLNIDLVAPDNFLAGSVNPILAVLLFFSSLALARLLIGHPIYLAWEKRFPGQSAFMKVAALVNLLIVAAATASLGYARQGQFGTAAFVLLLLSAITLIVIYVRIVSVVEERRLVESALTNREAALEKAQTIGRIGSWRLNWPQGDMEWSRESYRIFGVPVGSPLSLQNFMEIVYPDDIPAFQLRWRNALEGEVYDFEHRIFVGKRVRWVRERADFQWNDDRTQCECLGTVQDITDSKLKEIELLRSRELIRKLAAHNEQIREQERISIARELHDEMGQHLTALRLQTAMVQMQHGGSIGPLNDQLQDIKIRIDDTINVVRNVAARLRPPALDAGLVAACQWMLQNYVEPAGISTRLESNIDESLLNDALRTAAFRILQESLTNVVRHAHAKGVLVWITQDAHDLTISVTDNGQGFKPDEISTDLHFGLIGIRERALNFQGQTSIESAPGKGCSISVTLPLNDFSMITTRAV
ncbi:MAG: histidine kinase [Pseudohongiella sp.]|nr:histidine kinase [Pseudohongiella sp.]